MTELDIFKLSAYAGNSISDIDLIEKCWESSTKILQQGINAGKTIDFPLIGKFVSRSDEVLFVPNLEFLESGRFKF